MPLKFTETMKAAEHGFDKTPISKGIQLIEGWEAALSDVDTPGAKGVLKDLESLKKQLEKPEPDAEHIGKLLHQLGEATTKIAGRADKSEDNLKALGTALTGGR